MPPRFRRACARRLLRVALAAALAHTLGCQATPRAHAPDREAGIARIEPPAVGEPSQQAPVACAATLQPVSALAGQTVLLVVRLKTAPGWHIYPPGDAPAGLFPLTIEPRLPDALQSTGAWQEPAAARDPETGQEVLRGDLVLHRALRIDPAALPGNLQILVDVGFQACDPLLCLPPERKLITVELEILPPRKGDSR